MLIKHLGRDRSKNRGNLKKFLAVSISKNVFASLEFKNSPQLIRTSDVLSCSLPENMLKTVSWSYMIYLVSESSLISVFQCQYGYRWYDCCGRTDDHTKDGRPGRSDFCIVFTMSLSVLELKQLLLSLIF